MLARARFPLVALLLLPAAIPAQDRLRTMPGYERYAAMAPKLASTIKSGAITPQWAEDGGSFEFLRDGKRFRYTVATKAVTEAGPTNGGAAMGARRPNAPARGRQYTEAWTADSAMKAVYRDHNLFISARDGSGERQLTTDGSKERRIKYGTASWVYGEELDQVTAMWWSPSGTQLAYYRFDENPVKDYWLQMDQTAVQGSVMIEAYPKAGTQNPIVDLFVHDLPSGKTIRIDARDGKPLTDDVVGHYVYGITWSPDGSELLLRRTNRRQNIMEFAACSPTSGACRVLVREEWLASWTENSPTIRWLADGKRFIWESERNGFKN